MIDVEVVGVEWLSGVPGRAAGERPRGAPDGARTERPNGVSGRVGIEWLTAAPDSAEIERLCIATAAQAGVRHGHLAVEFVDERRIAELNEQHRGKQGPTDVLSFPIDGLDEQAGVERELGDIVICPQHTEDIGEAVVHGVLHLLGMDHETDDGEMLALQAEILAAQRGTAR